MTVGDQAWIYGWFQSVKTPGHRFSFDQGFPPVMDNRLEMLVEKRLFVLLQGAIVFIRGSIPTVFLVSLQLTSP